MASTQRPRVILVGYHGVGNFGDDLFFRIVAKNLAARLGDIDILVSTNSAESCPQVSGCSISGIYPPGKRIRRLDWLRLLIASYNCDVVIFSGGSIFAGRHQAELMYFLKFLRLLDKVRFKTRQVFGVGLSFGPFLSRKGLVATQRAIQYFNWLIVRDKGSESIARAFSKGIVIPAPDIALSLHSDFLAIRSGAKLSDEVIRIGIFIGPGFSYGDASALRPIVEKMFLAADNKGRNIAPMIFVTCPDRASSDASLARKLQFYFEDGGCNAPICAYDSHDPDKFIGNMFAMDCIISSRLHPALVSMSVGIPSLQVDSSQPKINDVFYSSGLVPISLLKLEDISVDSFEELLSVVESNAIESAEIADNVKCAAAARRVVDAALVAPFDELAAKILAIQT